MSQAYDTLRWREARRSSDELEGFVREEFPPGTTLQGALGGEEDRTSRGASPQQEREDPTGRATWWRLRKRGAPRWGARPSGRA